MVMLIVIGHTAPRHVRHGAIGQGVHSVINGVTLRIITGSSPIIITMIARSRTGLGSREPSRDEMVDRARGSRG